MRLIAIIYVLFLSMPFSAYSASNTSSMNEIKQYVDELVSKATNVLNHSTLSESEKIAQASELMRKNLDFPWMAGFAIGADKKSLTAAQYEKFISAYTQYTINSYTSLLKSYKNPTVKVLKVIPINKDQSEFIVKTKIITNVNDPEVSVDYLVRRTPEGIRVADIIAEGVSVLRSQQAEFHSIITTKGFDALLEELTRPRR